MNPDDDFPFEDDCEENNTEKKLEGKLEEETIPKIGDIYYLGSKTYKTHREKIYGGKARIKKVIAEEKKGKIKYKVEFEQHPHVMYAWLGDTTDWKYDNTYDYIFELKEQDKLKMKYGEKWAHPERYFVILQYWLQKRDEWGGYSIHLTLEDCRQFIVEYMKKFTYILPPEPYREPHKFTVDKKTYEELKKRKNQDSNSPFFHKCGIKSYGDPYDELIYKKKKKTKKEAIKNEST